MSDDLDKTRLPDCVNNDTFEEVKDEPESAHGLALRWRGKPFGELARRDQTLIMSCINGNRRELEAQVKALKTNNMLSAHERIDRLNDRLVKMGNLVDMGIDDAAELFKNDDFSAVYPGQVHFKTKAGSSTRKLRHLDRLNRVVKGYVDINTSIAKLEERSGAVFVKEGNKTDNRTLVVTPDSVREQLSQFAEGEIVDQSGDGSVSDKSTDA